jgi:hypothetical protein
VNPIHKGRLKCGRSQNWPPYKTTRVLTGSPRTDQLKSEFMKTQAGAIPRLPPVVTGKSALSTAMAFA